MQMLPNCQFYEAIALLPIVNLADRHCDFGCDCFSLLFRFDVERISEFLFRRVKT